MLIATCPACENPDLVPSGDGGKYLNREPLAKFYCGRCDKRYTWNDLAADYNCKGAEPCKEKNDCGCGE